MILYFLRHGDAGEPRAHDDDARELSPEGEAALRAAAATWRRLKVRPDVVISSPLPRAMRTAELLIEGIGLDLAPVVAEGLRPGAGWEAMADAMAAQPEARRVMFVGHDPDLAQAISLLTGASSISLRKGGIAAVEFDDTPAPDRGKLSWLVDPSVYEPGADATS